MEILYLNGFITSTILATPTGHFDCRAACQTFPKVSALVRIQYKVSTESTSRMCTPSAPALIVLLPLPLLQRRSPSPPQPRARALAWRVRHWVTSVVVVQSEHIRAMLPPSSSSSAAAQTTHAAAQTTQAAAPKRAVQGTRGRASQPARRAQWGLTALLRKGALALEVARLYQRRRRRGPVVAALQLTRFLKSQCPSAFSYRSQHVQYF